MAILVTRADVEAIKGPRYIAELLLEARDPAATEAEQLAQEEARLERALQSGDNLIKQFLPLQGLAPAHPQWDVLHELAVHEALYYLQKTSDSGAGDADHAAAELRRKDLAHMRKREQWPGTSDYEVSVRATFVEPASPFAMSKLTGLT